MAKRINAQKSRVQRKESKLERTINLSFEKVKKELKERYKGDETRLNAIDNIYVETFSPKRVKEYARKLKLYLSNSILSKKDQVPIDEELPIVYFASGMDIEFPLLLNQNSIKMIDPVFKNKIVIDNFENIIKNKYHGIKKKSLNYEIPITKNGKCKNIKIELLPFTSSEYEQKEKLGIYIEFLPPPGSTKISSKKNYINNMANNGLAYFFYTPSINSPFSTKEDRPEYYGFEPKVIAPELEIFRKFK